MYLLSLVLRLEAWTVALPHRLLVSLWTNLSNYWYT